jgi:hypothetical protein
MATQRIVQGWRAFSATEEGTIGTPETISAGIGRLNFEGEPSESRPKDTFDNNDEITGSNEMTKFEVLTRTVELTHTQRAIPHACSLFFAMCLGKVTTDRPTNGTATGFYRHYIERDLTTVVLQPVTMWEYDGLRQRVFHAVACRSVMLTGERNGFVRIDAELVGRGSEATTSESKPSQADEAYLRYGDITVYRGGGFTGTVGSGNLTYASTSISSDTHDGSGLNDITVAGTNTGEESTTYRIEIMTVGTPDVFKWRASVNAAYTTGVNCATGAITLQDGITVLWAANNGHTLGDAWEVTVVGVKTDMSAKVIGFDYKVDNAMEPVYELGDQTFFAKRFERAGRFIHTLNVKFELEDQEHHDKLLTNSGVPEPMTLSIPIVGDAVSTLNYQCILWFPQVRYISATNTRDGEKLICDATFQVEEDATYGSVIIETANKTAAYLT